MIAPIIETPRLILAPLAADRFEEHMENMGDERVMRFLGTPRQAQKRIDVWRRFCQGVGLWSLLGYGYWAAIDKASDRMIGMGGLAQFEREMAQLEGVAEAGWAFAYSAWGRGIATEFMSAVYAWADATCDLPVIRCIIDPANVASIRVAEKTGFRQIDATEDDFGAINIYERLKPPAPIP